ncbi:DUF4348 domain-containing protein [Prevotella bivia]|uniref:DUF4348 domain-containing protein n=1 Tax=Prevotella bivia TaxID=28125 RepID=UPI00288B17CC|nr:DUF4348 domain-containing protein [Prevotella bivia]
MKKLTLVVVTLFATMICFTTGCTSKKTETTNDSSQTDSTILNSTEEEDSASKVIAETPMPKTADQLFDDFFFNFIANNKLQRARIKFPLYQNKFGKISNLPRSKWSFDRFFRPQGYYTLILDNEEQAKYAHSTDIDSVVVEKIFLKENTVKQYWFDHQEGKWMMSQIRELNFKESYNADFLNFVKVFFKKNGEGMVKNPLPYKGSDPNGEETNIINTTIPAEEWSTFLPEIPNNVIFNILYGQKYKPGKEKILTFRGLANGLETELIFQNNGKKWQLVKIVAF